MFLERNGNGLFISLQALVNIATEMNVDRIALISADHRATRAFLSEAADVGIRVDDIYEYKSFPTIYSKGRNLHYNDRHTYIYIPAKCTQQKIIE